MRRLSRIRVKGYKSIDEMSVDLNPLNVLIGSNGAGKSNFIGVFRLLSRIAERQLVTHVAEQGGANSLLHFGRRRTPFLRVELSIEKGTNWYCCELQPNNRDQFYFQREECAFEGPVGQLGQYVLKESSLPVGGLESSLPAVAEASPGKVESFVLGDLKSWRIYHFHDTQSSAGVKQTGDLGDNRFLRHDASNLAAFLYWLQKRRPEVYRQVRETVRLIAPFIDDFVLEPTALNPEKILLEWKAVGSDEYFSVSALSDGTLRFICLAALLFQPDLPSLVLIDEPELGLHPAAITLLTVLLRQASERSQVIVSTQSVTLVNQLKPAEVIVVEQNQGASRFNRLQEADLKDWLGDYALGDLWEKNLLGGRP